MGCDIHAAVEWERRKADDRGGAWWVHILDCGFLPRNYRMFSCMVDGHSRDYDEVGGVAPERGLPPLPSDIRGSVEYFRKNESEPHVYDNAVCGADHTFSWLTPQEYRAAIVRYGEGLSPSYGGLDPEWLALADYLDQMAQAGDVRLVFGFDN